MFDNFDFDLTSFLLGAVLVYVILYAYYTYFMSESFGDFGSDPNTYSPYPEKMTTAREWNTGDRAVDPRTYV